VATFSAASAPPSTNSRRWEVSSRAAPLLPLSQQVQLGQVLQTLRGPDGFDHIGFNVTDFGKTKDLLTKTLAPLGISITGEGQNWAMIGRKDEGGLWFGSHGPSPGPIHVAFAAKSREEFRKFYEAAIAAGGKDNGVPGLREH